MKKGEYIRYKYEDITYIGKITFISEVMLGLDETLAIDIDNCMEEVYKNDIIKSSPNIMDLIEVGDYVNGHKVKGVYKPEGTYALWFILSCNPIEVWKNEDIKSIITHEQISQMEYKIESEVN